MVQRISQWGCIEICNVIRKNNYILFFFIMFLEGCKLQLLSWKGNKCFTKQIAGGHSSCWLCVNNMMNISLVEYLISFHLMFHLSIHMFHVHHAYYVDTYFRGQNVPAKHSLTVILNLRIIKHAASPISTSIHMVLPYCTMLCLNTGNSNCH